jgi:hypothetical protein
MINLLPYKEKKIVEHVRIMRVVTVTLSMVTILVIIAGVLLLPTYITITSRYALAQKNISKLEKEGVITNNINIEDIDKRTNELVKKLTAPDDTPPAEYVALVRGASNNQIRLTGFSLATNNKTGAISFAVSGIALNREALQQYVSSLQKLEQVATVDSPISNYVKSKDADFAITLSFKKP